MALRTKPNCKVILCGGSFNPDSAIFVPNGISSELDNLCPTIAFISAAGITPKQGATCFNLDEIALKQKAIQRARRSVLIADASKFGEVKPAWIAPLPNFPFWSPIKLPVQRFASSWSWKTYSYYANFYFFRSITLIIKFMNYSFNFNWAVVILPYLKLNYLPFTNSYLANSFTTSELISHT